MHAVCERKAACSGWGRKHHPPISLSDKDRFEETGEAAASSYCMSCVNVCASLEKLFCRVPVHEAGRQPKKQKRFGLFLVGLLASCKRRLGGGMRHWGFELVQSLACLCDVFGLLAGALHRKMREIGYI